MPILKCSDLSKHFGGLKAVNCVNFDVEEDKILGIIGPNGSGKTTMFNLITGFIPADSGSINFLGKNIVGMRPHKICRRGLTRTFQIPRPFNHLTVLENTVIGILYGNENVNIITEARKRAEEVISFCGLAEKQGVLAMNLTVPDRKRLELCRALATKPKVLLLDEVMAGLNLVEVDLMIKLVNKIRDDGVTILIVEHVMKAIMGVSDNIIVLNHGVKIAEGTPEEIKRNETVIEAYLGEEDTQC